jgi:hypothetical protein
MIMGTIITGASTGAAARHRRAMRSSRIQIFGIVLLMAAVASMPLSIAYVTWADHQAMRAEWDVAGLACPVVASVTQAYRRAPMAFTYGGAHFTRQIGGVTCVFVPEGGLFNSASYPVCQFTSPAIVRVTVGGRTVIFEPGVGHSATVALRRGAAPSCVVGAPHPF